MSDIVVMEICFSLVDSIMTESQEGISSAYSHAR